MQNKSHQRSRKDQLAFYLYKIYYHTLDEMLVKMNSIKTLYIFSQKLFFFIYL